MGALFSDAAELRSGQPKSRLRDASAGRLPAGSGRPPDRAGLYMPPERLTVLESVVAALIGGTAVTVVTGPRGAGKTVLADAAVALLADQSLRVIRLRGQEGVPLSLNRLLGQVLDMPEGLPKDDEMRACELLFSPPDGERATVLVVDDAHVAQPEALRLLGMASGSPRLTGHAVQLLLVGMPELSAALDGDGTWSLHGQAILRAALEPYTESAARGFVSHWLRHTGAAGTVPPTLKDDALGEILDRGAGLPGALDGILDAVTRAARGRRRPVTRQMVCRALEPPPADETAPHRGPAARNLPWLLALAMVLAGGLFAATHIGTQRHGPAADGPPGHGAGGTAGPAAEPRGEIPAPRSQVPARQTGAETPMAPPEVPRGQETVAPETMPPQPVTAGKSGTAAGQPAAVPRL